MNNIKIGIAYHKKAKFYNVDPFIAIQVGAWNKEDLGIQKDSEGDNLSKMNAYCSEVSATYWLWKNCNAEYKGLFHYRRFLSFESESFFTKIPRWSLYYLAKLASPFFRDSRYSLLAYPVRHISEGEVSKYLESFSYKLNEDIDKNHIDCYSMGPVRRSNERVGTGLIRAIGYWHNEYIYNLIKKDFPDFFKYYNQTIKSYESYSYNIIIAKTELFEEYCSILFSILSRYHEYMNNGIKEDTTNNALIRDSGYIAEIITSAVIIMFKERGAKVKHLGEIEVNFITSTESQYVGSVKERIKSIIRN